MVMREYCWRKGYFKSGGYFFDKDQACRNLGIWNLLITRSGYFQSVRAVHGGLTLNVDVASSAFYRLDMPLDQAWDTFRRYCLPDKERRLFSRWTTQSSWNEEQVEIADKNWKKLQIGSSHRHKIENEGSLKSFAIYQLQRNCASETHVQGLYDMQFLGNLTQFMRDKYRLDPSNLCEHMPAIKLSKTNEHYLPWGCCYTTYASHFSNKLEDSRLLKDLERDPQTRCMDILEWMDKRHRYTSIDILHLLMCWVWVWSGGGGKWTCFPACFFEL